MMNVNKMKDILAKKLKEENAYFGKSDISMKKQGEAYKIVIKGYEHIYFKMTFSYDDDFGYEVWIYDSFDNCNIIYVDSKKDYNVENALVQLGYHIAMCF